MRQTILAEPNGAVQILAWADVAPKSNYRQRFADAAQRAGKLLEKIAIDKNLKWPLTGLWIDANGYPDSDSRFDRSSPTTYFLVCDGSGLTASVALHWLPPAPKRGNFSQI
jgi:hypothetical protein